MFTGIVTAVGVVKAVERRTAQLRITVASPYRDLEPGESVAVNGACLTVVCVDDGDFVVEAIVTTRDRTTVNEWTAGRRLNLERALAIGDRLGGHFVQGHVDAVGEVVRVTERADAILVDVRVPVSIARLCVPHGSIALDGVSLTINAMPESDVVQVALIPHTREHTTLGEVGHGSRVHLEGDLIGKFVERLVEVRDP